MVQEKLYKSKISFSMINTSSWKFFNNRYFHWLICLFYLHARLEITISPKLKASSVIFTDRNQNLCAIRWLMGINLSNAHIGTKVSEHSKRPAVISKHYWGIKALVLIKMRKCHGRVLGGWVLLCDIADISAAILLSLLIGSVGRLLVNVPKWDNFLVSFKENSWIVFAKSSGKCTINHSLFI